MKERPKRIFIPSADKGLSRHLTALMGIGISVCCAAFGVWGHTLDTSINVAATSAPTHMNQSSSVPAFPPSGSAISRIDIEVITLRPNGFERTEITRPKGLFGIAVENRSGLADIVLRLDQEGGNRLGQAQLSSKKLSWKDALDLQPGRYLLSEASNSSWICRLTITDK